MTSIDKGSISIDIVVVDYYRSDFSTSGDNK